jgi:hypothetical protein
MVPAVRVIDIVTSVDRVRAVACCATENDA